MAADAARLLFEWPPRRRLSMPLLGFCALSFIGHALAFYLFQIVYPPPVAVAPPPAQVTLISASNPGHEAIFSWINAEDPGRIFVPPMEMSRELMEMKYRPSYADFAIAPAPPESLAPAVDFPSAPVPEPRQEVSPKREIAGQATSIRFSGALADRELLRTPQFSPNPVEAVLEQASLLIGVSAEGDVRYVFLQRSSGDSAADAQAERYLKQLSFVPRGERLEWGRAIFSWGIDSYRVSKQK